MQVVLIPLGAANIIGDNCLVVQGEDEGVSGFRQQSGSCRLQSPMGGSRTLPCWPAAELRDMDFLKCSCQ